MKATTTRFSTHGPPYSTIQKLKFCQITDTSDFKLECVHGDIILNPSLVLYLHNVSKCF